MIYVLYGQPGSGKTTLGKHLEQHLKCQPNGCDAVMIDGDDLRALFTNTDYTKKGRYQNIRNANAIATYAEHVLHRDTVMTLVNPYKCLRDELRVNNKSVTEVFLWSKRSLREEYHVKEFEKGNPQHMINTDSLVKQTWRTFKTLLQL